MPIRQGNQPSHFGTDVGKEGRERVGPMLLTHSKGLRCHGHGGGNPFKALQRPDPRAQKAAPIEARRGEERGSIYVKGRLTSRRYLSRALLG